MSSAERIVAPASLEVEVRALRDRAKQYSEVQLASPEKDVSLNTTWRSAFRNFTERMKPRTEFEMSYRSMSDLCIYDIDVDKCMDNLNHSDISERNKTLITEFIDNCYIDRLGEHRIIKYISVLKNIAIAINVDFDKLEIQQLWT